MHLVSAESNGQGASNKPRLEGFSAVSGSRGTPTFWPWPGHGDFCRSDYALRGLVAPFGAES